MGFQIGLILRGQAAVGQLQSNTREASLLFPCPPVQILNIASCSQQRGQRGSQLPVSAW